MPILNSNSSPEELARMGFEVDARAWYEQAQPGFEMPTPKEVMAMRGENLELAEENKNLRNNCVRLQLRVESLERQLGWSPRLKALTAEAHAEDPSLFAGLNQLSLGKLADGFSELVPRSPEPHSILYTPTEHPVAASPARAEMLELDVERKD